MKGRKKFEKIEFKEKIHSKLCVSSVVDHKFCYNIVKVDKFCHNIVKVDVDMDSSGVVK